MEIHIISELQRLQDLQLRRIKRQFLAESFRDNPEDAKWFVFEDIDRECLVYPKGTFSIHGFFNYLGQEFRIIATLRDGTAPWVSVFSFSQEYQFRSMADAISFCKSYRRRVNPYLAQHLTQEFNQIDSIVKRRIDWLLDELTPEDRILVKVDEFGIQHSYQFNCDTLWVSFSYKGIKIDMACSIYPYDPEDNGVLEFRVNYKMKRELSSLYEAIEFLKTNPEYIEPLDEFDRKQSKKK